MKLVLFLVVSIAAVAVYAQKYVVQDLENYEVNEQITKEVHFIWYEFEREIGFNMNLGKIKKVTKKVSFFFVLNLKKNAFLTFDKYFCLFNFKGMA